MWYVQLLTDCTLRPCCSSLHLGGSMHSSWQEMQGVAASKCVHASDRSSLQIPTVVAEARRALDAGQAVVIGMQSTGKARPCSAGSISGCWRVLKAVMY